MPMEILFVEGNCGDVRLTKDVLLGVNNPVTRLVASDGIEAMAYLEPRGRIRPGSSSGPLSCKTEPFAKGVQTVR